MFGFTNSHYEFKEIKASATKSGKCHVCGNRCSQSTTVSQTVNPFNKNKDGIQKTEKEIRQELNAELDQWRKLPIIHTKCKQ